MKTISSTILICSSLVATFVADAHDMPTNLKGAVQAATSDEYYSPERNPSVETDNYVALSDDASYTYQFRMDLSTPLSMDLFDGTAAIDKCIGWDISVSPTNFTWYGISFQLPVDAKGRGGGWNNAPAQPLKEDGYVQMFNNTAEGVAEYNFTTSADSPVIRARINNDLLWDTFTFDFTDGSNYVEHQSLQSVSCIAQQSDDGTGKSYITVSNPILTISLERLSGPAPAPTPAPEPSSSSMAGSVFAITALASSAFLLL